MRAGQKGRFVRQGERVSVPLKRRGNFPFVNHVGKIFVTVPRAHAAKPLDFNAFFTEIIFRAVTSRPYGAPARCPLLPGEGRGPVLPFRSHAPSKYALTI